MNMVVALNTQVVFTRSKSGIETLEQFVKYVQSDSALL